MTAKEIAAVAAAAALLGLGAFGVSEVRDAAQKEAFVAALQAESGKAVFATETEAQYSDGGWKFAADTFDVIAVSTRDAGSGFAMRAGAGSTLVILSDSPCVIPDCSTAEGWDDNHEPVDCIFQYPGEQKRWRGCTVGAAKYALGAACLPTACLESNR